MPTCVYCGNISDDMQQEVDNPKHIFCNGTCQEKHYSVPFDGDIEKLTLENDNYRKVLYTTPQQQLVIMSIEDEIGMETHECTTQLIRIESGTGQATIDGKIHELKDGSLIVIPPNTSHNVVNTGDTPLKFYSVYSPKHHAQGLVQKNKPLDGM